MEEACNTLSWVYTCDLIHIPWRKLLSLAKSVTIKLTNAIAELSVQGSEEGSNVSNVQKLSNLELQNYDLKLCNLKPMKEVIEQSFFSDYSSSTMFAGYTNF